jgi:hypothetical protein
VALGDVGDASMNVHTIEVKAALTVNVNGSGAAVVGKGTLTVIQGKLADDAQFYPENYPKPHSAASWPSPSTEAGLRPGRARSACSAFARGMITNCGLVNTGRRVDERA